MFTGIIEQTGTVSEVIDRGGNKTFWVVSPIWQDLKADQSLSHNGVCLTVEETVAGRHRVTAISETLQKTNLGNWKEGTHINLERCMPMNGRFDGHIVQGHVDAVAECTEITEKAGSMEFRFLFPVNFNLLVIEKGSICLNGISLTVFNVVNNSFTVAIIPYTYEHTNMHILRTGDTANIEFDIIGKYVNRIMALRNL